MLAPARRSTDTEDDRHLGQVEARAFDAYVAGCGLRRAVDGLSEAARRRRFRLYEDLSFADIAAACNITANNAKVNFHHAVKNIRRSLAAARVA